MDLLYHFPFHELNENDLLNELITSSLVNTPLPFSRYCKSVFINPSLTESITNSENSNYGDDDDLIDCSYYDYDTFHNLFGNESFGCNIFFNNVRSVPKNFESLRTSTLDSILNKINFIGLCETRLDKDIEDIYQIDNFCLFTNNNCRDKGGVAIFAKSSLNCKEVPNLSITEIYMETIFIQYTFLGIKHIIGVIYRRPGTDNELFMTKIEEILDNPLIKNNKCILMGDLNYDLLKMNKCRWISGYANLLFSNNFTLLTTRPTRIGSSSATLIDHIWSNFSEHDLVSGILTTDHSDHFSPFICSARSNVQNTEPVIISYRNFNYTEKEGVQRSLSAKINQVTDNENIDSHFKSISNILKESMDECFPLKTIKIKQKSAAKPWITDELKALIKQKNKLYSKYIKRPITHGDEYRALRNRVTHLTRDCKRQFYCSQLEDAKGDSKKTWKIISKLMNKPKREGIKELSIDGETITDNQLICENLNKYFANIGKSIEESCTDSDTHFSEYLSDAHPSFELSPVTSDDVIKVVKGMKTSGAGSDGINMRLIKEGVDVLAPSFVNLINKSFSDGVYPDELKIAKITPIFKGGDRSLMENYRQISILNAANKIFEKIVYTQLLKHAGDNNIFTPDQFGFLKSVSTQDALLNFLNTVNCDLSQNKFTCAIFLDLAKAFDSLNHDILLEKLKYYGIRNSAYAWLKSYLTNRKQYTVINNCKSSYVKITLRIQC